MNAMQGARRLPARSDELLSAAMIAFSKQGYFGTSTAAVAEAMGVSQPYVIRVFGSKIELFVRTHAFAGEFIVAAFERGLREGFDPARIGAAYRDLVVARPEAVLVFAHGFSAAHAEPAIGAESRRLFDQIYRTFAAAGADVAAIYASLGRGMLINALLLLDAPRHADAYAYGPLVEHVLGRSPGASGRRAADEPTQRSPAPGKASAQFPSVPRKK